MTDSEKLFIELIQVSIGNRQALSHLPTETEWEELFSLADKHALLGICIAGIEKLPESQILDSDLFLEWMGQSELIRARNDIVNLRCIELQEYFTKAGLRSCILKGQCAAKYYGNLASLREPGDIDIWVEGGRKTILEFVQNTYPTKQVIRQHVHFHIFDDVEVEVHFSPSELMSPVHHKRLQKWFHEQEPMELNFVEDVFTGPSAKFDAVFMLSHLYKHLMSEGIGLRQVMDYYFMLKSASFGSKDKADVMFLLDRFGMRRFAGSIMWVIMTIFYPAGTGEPEWILCSPDEKDGKMVLEEIMASGNFGYMDERRGHAKNAIGRLLEPRFLTWKLAGTHPLEYFFTPVNRIRQRIWMMAHGYKA